MTQTASVKRKRRGRPRNEAKPKFGCAVLPENGQFITGKMALVPSTKERTRPAPVNGNEQGVSRGQVEDRLMRAMATLRSLPDKERRFFIYRSGYPEYVQSYMDAYGSAEAVAPKFQPTPFDVSDYLTALSWTRHLKKDAWQILWWRSFGLSFGLIAKYIGRSDETARGRYREALIDAWAAATGLAANAGQVAKHHRGRGAA